MKSFIQICKNIFSVHNNIKKPLGRWNIDYCNNKIGRKIDLSNEDHCGPCGEYLFDKSKIALKKQPIPNIVNIKK